VWVWLPSGADAMGNSIAVKFLRIKSAPIKRVRRSASECVGICRSLQPQRNSNVVFWKKPSTGAYILYWSFGERWNETNPARAGRLFRPDVSLLHHFLFFELRNTLFLDHPMAYIGTNEVIKRKTSVSWNIYSIQNSSMCLYHSTIQHETLPRLLS
jgi:hypothetical protein